MSLVNAANILSAAVILVWCGHSILTHKDGLLGKALYAVSMLAALAVIVGSAQEPGSIPVREITMNACIAGLVLRRAVLHYFPKAPI